MFSVSIIECGNCKSCNWSNDPLSLNIFWSTTGEKPNGVLFGTSSNSVEVLYSNVDAQITPHLYLILV